MRERPAYRRWSTTRCVASRSSSPATGSEWERLSQVPSFGRLLMSAPLAPDDLPGRNDAPLREADF